MDYWMNPYFQKAEWIIKAFREFMFQTILGNP